MSTKQNVLPIAGLLSGAAVWGLIWYPYRLIEQTGTSGVLATFLTYTIALAVGLSVSGPVWREFRLAGWSGVALIIGSGWANFGYVLATLEGEVMRVLLLFYLAPLWTVFLAHFLLGEKLNRYGYGVVALSLGGAIVMLWRPELGVPMPQNRAEWIGLSAGITFALTNVLVRRNAHLSVGFKSAAIWFGTFCITGIALLYQGGAVLHLPQIAAGTWTMIVLVGLVLCATSFAVQYGLTHTPANQAIVIFLFELVFAGIASYLLVGEEMNMQEIIGALLIVSASLLSGRMHAAH
ncbi:MAG: DMT family transporter [Gallionellaceae bacterium]|nr:DMT family transporter [Gallionellaceae bacterium]